MKKIVITGAGRGIGKAIVYKFAQTGAESIVITARTEAELMVLSNSIVEEFKNIKIFYKKCDLSKADNIKILKEFCLKKIGTPDIIVNNAGYYEASQLQNESSDLMEKMMQINFFAAYNLSREFIPYMIENKSGHIINIASIAAVQALKNGGAYAVSKSALYTMSRLLRQELKEYGIKVSSVLPGATYTGSWEGSGIDKNTLIQAEDVAEMVYAISNLSASAVVEELIMRPLGGDLK